MFWAFWSLVLPSPLAPWYCQGNQLLLSGNSVVVWRNNWTPIQLRKGQPVYVDRQDPWRKWCPNIGKSVRTTLILSFLYLPEIPWIPSKVSTWLFIYERGVKRAWFSQLGDPDCPAQSSSSFFFFYVVNFLAVISVIYYIFLHVWGASCSTAAGLSNHTPCPLLVTRGSMPKAALRPSRPRAETRVRKLWSVFRKHHLPCSKPRKYKRI